jgi:hypothetical protein
MLALTRFNRLQTLYKTTKQIRLKHNSEEQKLLRERNCLIDAKNVIDTIKCN